MTKQAYAKAKRIEVVAEGRAQPEDPERGHAPRAERWVLVASGAGALLFCLVTYLLHLDRVAGMYVDDAYYVLLAKALATGQGYMLINAPSPGIMPLYPPAFPWLLSLVYRLAPQFPENVWLLKSLSIAAMLGVGVVTYHYFVRNRKLPHYVALGIAAATVISPPLIFFATTTVMSECVFMLAQLLTIVVIERCVRARAGGRVWHYALLASVLASFTFLTRSISVVLIIAAFAYLLKERLWRAALVFAAGVVLCIGPWMIYARAHAPTAEQRMEHGSYIVQGYTTQFWQKNAAEASSGSASVGDLARRIALNTIRILRSEVGAVFVAPLTEFIKDRSVRVGEGFSYILSILAVVGFMSVVRQKITLAELVVPLTLVIVVAWPWWPQRFVLPLSPFLIFYVLMGVGAGHRLYERLRQTSSPRARWSVACVVVWCAVALNTLGNVKQILSLHQISSEPPKRIENFEEVEAMFKWIRETLPKEDVIATFNPALVHLYTGHKTIFPDDPTGDWENWRRPGVRYLVFTPWHRVLDFKPTEDRRNIVYQSGSFPSLRVVDLNPAAARLP